MNVKGNHPLSEIIARCMSGGETVPNDCMRSMVNRACREAVKYHKAALQSHNTGSLPLCRSCIKLHACTGASDLEKYCFKYEGIAATSGE